MNYQDKLLTIGHSPGYLVYCRFYCLDFLARAPLLRPNVKLAQPMFFDGPFPPDIEPKGTKKLWLLYNTATAHLNGHETVADIEGVR
jgi:hypothetical protein